MDVAKSVVALLLIGIGFFGFMSIDSNRSARMRAPASALGRSECPGSPVSTHASCAFDVHFPSTSCASIRKKMVSRVQKNKDRKSKKGTYEMIDDDSDSGKIKAQRTSHDGYVDKFDVVYQESGEGCVVRACSESQVRSMYDFSTNYCNVHNLLCNKDEGCGKSSDNFEYDETFGFMRCPFHDATMCDR